MSHEQPADALPDEVVALHQQACKSLETGDLDEAERLATELVATVARAGPSSTDTVYYDLRNAIEKEYLQETLHDARCIAVSPIRQMPALMLLARVKIERGAYEAALAILARAAARNPVAVQPRFHRLQLFQEMGRYEEVFREALELHPLCYGANSFACLYRHLAYCAIEGRDWERAAALILVGLHFEDHPTASNGLAFIENVTGHPLDLPSLVKAVPRLLAEKGIPLQPNPLWRRLVQRFQERCREQGDHESEAAFLDIIRDLDPPVDFEAVVSKIGSERFGLGADSAITPEQASPQQYGQFLRHAIIGAEHAAEALQPRPRKPSVAEMGNMLLEAARSLDVPISDRCAWEELPLPVVDAALLTVPAGGAVAVVTGGLVAFADLLAGLVASLVSAEPTEEGAAFAFAWPSLERGLHASTEADRRFVEILLAAAGRGNLLQLPRWQHEGHQRLLAAILRHCGEMFALAAQLVLADPASLAEAARRRMTPVPHLHVERFALPVQQLVDADGFGFHLALEVALNEGPGVDASLVCVGIGLLLDGLAIVETLQGAPQEPVDGFLPASVRYEVVQQVLSYKGESAEGALELMGTFHRLIGELWHRNRHVIMERWRMPPRSEGVQ